MADGTIKSGAESEDTRRKTENFGLRNSDSALPTCPVPVVHRPDEIWYDPPLFWEPQRSIEIILPPRLERR